MNIGEVSKLSGVSVRTLHHYEGCGLLRPGRNADNGYREYGEADLDTLQQILFFRACGFGLSQIKTMLNTPGFDRQAAFLLQKKHLTRERERIQTMLDTLDNTIRATRGEIAMSTEDKFKGFDFRKNPYEEEARTLWGDDVVNDSNAALQSLGKDGQEKLGEEFSALFRELATLRHLPPESGEAQAAMEKMHHFFNTRFGVHYSLEAFAGLGEMYVADERFTRNIDQYGKGLAAFLAGAMARFAQQGESGRAAAK